MSTPTTRTVASACPLDCPDFCSLDVTVRGEEVVKVDGNSLNPLTDGFICAKVRALPRHLRSRERLLYPLVRPAGAPRGTFERASWDTALELVARQLRAARDEHGGESILPLSYGGSNGFLSQDTTDARLFRRLGASRLARTVCAAATGRAAVGLYGKMPGMALEDFVHARLIVVWGANPSDSGIHLVPVVQEAQRRGAQLVVIDPRRIPLAKKADLHLAVRPGADLPVALAVLRRLFEEGGADAEFLAAHATGGEELRRRAAPWSCERAAAVAGVDPAQIAEFARLYAAADPAAIRCGWGVERNRNGGSAVAAILALPAVGGKFGKRGGGYTLSNTGAWRFDLEPLINEPEPATRRVNMNRVGAVLADAAPPVKALFVYNANPLMTLPDQERVRAGMMREDLFTVVFDSILTDTALLADVVLPATTFLEHTDLRRGYGAMALQLVRPAIPPQGEARPNLEVFAELCRRLGLARPDEPETTEEVLAALIAQQDGPAALRAALDDPGIAFSAVGRTPVQMVDVFPRTPDGKVHLVPPALDEEAPDGLYGFRPDPATARYPLALISPATRRTISSTFGQLWDEPAAVELAPADAAARGLATGDRVRVWNDLGEVRCRVRVSDDLTAGVVFLPKGLWARHTENGATANALVPADLTDLAGGACFNDARVEVAKQEASLVD